MKYKSSLGSKLFDAFNYLFLTLLTILFLYPFLYVIFASLSDTQLFVQQRGILLAPVGFSLNSYLTVFKTPEIWVGYGNTILYLVTGTALNIVLTTLGAYVLSRRKLYFKNAMMAMITFTMFFSGGLIPSFLLVKSLGMFNTLWAVIVPIAISAWNLIIMRTTMMQIPAEMEEAAIIDGANAFQVLMKVILPLSTAIIAVMVLFYAEGHWNSWFRESIYLKDRSLYPLQLLLREILIQNELMQLTINAGGDVNFDSVAETIKYAIIVVATVPILLVYPFIQKYFTQGVMVGSLKG